MLLEKNKCDVIEGEATLTGEGRVKVGWGEGQQSFDYVCIAAGRAPDAEALNLAQLGIETDDRRLIQVDPVQRTTREGFYAIGDIVPGPALAHKASEDGVIAVEAVAGMN